MKKFRFSLQTVYRYKGQVLETLKEEHAHIALQLAEVVAQINKLEDVFFKTNRKLTTEMQTGLHSSDISVYKTYLAEVDAGIVSLNHKRQQIELLLEKKRQEVIAVNTEIMGMEKLRDKQLEEYRYQEQKSSQAFIEEFVSNAQSQR